MVPCPENVFNQEKIFTTDWEKEITVCMAAVYEFARSLDYFIIKYICKAGCKGYQWLYKSNFLCNSIYHGIWNSEKNVFNLISLCNIIYDIYIYNSFIFFLNF